MKDMKCPCVIYCSISLADNELIPMRKVRNVVLQKVHIVSINGQRFLTMIRLWPVTEVPSSKKSPSFTSFLPSTFQYEC